MALLGGTAAGASAETRDDSANFDQGVKAAAALSHARAGAASVEEPKAARQADALWISLAAEDMPKIEQSKLPLGPAVMTGDRASVFRIEEKNLPALSAFMHEEFGRCGGFFAHDSAEEAQADLGPSPAAMAGPFTVDQQAFVAPAVSKVRESELRATIEKLTTFHNRYYSADSGVAAAKWIQGRWQELASPIPGATTRLVQHSGWKQNSVVLTIPGSEKPEEIVVLGGHLDSINGMWGGEGNRAPGADDNASGIAVLTESIRVLAASGFRPRRTVEFMGYAAEEVGLRGSKEIAASYAKQGKKVSAVIQFDMTNFKGSNEAIFLLTDNVDPTVTAFLGKLIDAYGQVSWSTTKCGYGCSDHASWTRSGYPASAAFESSFDGMNHDIHTDRDTLSKSGGTAEHSVPFAKLAASFAAEVAKVAAPAAARSAR